MSKTYINSILISLCGIVITILVYHFSLSTEEEDRSFDHETRYQFVEVKGAIQPIPSIERIHPGWVKLGKALFNSPLLSSDNSVSCATCHNLYAGGEDGFPVSTGIKGRTGTRNSPTVLNAVFNFRQFWDGRSTDLADQILGPIHNPVEMGSNWPQVIKKLNADPDFVRSFAELSPDGISVKNIIKAIATFQEALVTPNAPIDRFLKGDKRALSEQQKRGYQKFINIGCASCHQGRNIGGNLYQKVGRIDKVPEKLLDDKGRYDLSGQASDEYVFKVPSLRNISLTAPYFHNGSVANLEEAVMIMARSQLGVELSAQDVEDLVALLEGFTGELPAVLQ